MRHVRTSTRTVPVAIGRRVQRRQGILCQRRRGAITCTDWDRMNPGQKSAAIDRMISSAIAGQGGRQYNISRPAVGRCLQSHARQIEYDFDDACSDARTASMRALNRIFKDYIWSCAG